MNDGYETRVLPLLYRMTNLEELTLNIKNENRNTFIYGTQISELVVYMSQLQIFNFHLISTIKTINSSESNDSFDSDISIEHLSSDDIRHTFSGIEYERTDCIWNKNYGSITCHVFSLPFVFDLLDPIGNGFPSIVFTSVTHIRAWDIDPFEHDFFVRVACCFPMLAILDIYNLNSKLQSSNELNIVIEFPQVHSIRMHSVHHDYIEQFLSETKIRLPRLHKISMNYQDLVAVTDNFTKESTKNTCAKLKELFIDGNRVYSKEFYDYFPSLLLVDRHDYYMN